VEHKEITQGIFHIPLIGKDSLLNKTGIFQACHQFLSLLEQHFSGEF
jgi:hypothetical protein